MKAKAAAHPRRAVMRRLPSSDPRSPDHPSHDEAWAALARSIGRALADQLYDEMKAEHEPAKEKSSTLR
jgi:hypothetical protein